MVNATNFKEKKSLYVPKPGEVIKVVNFTELEKLFELKLLNGQELGHKPGQFVEVSVFGYGEAPISISSSPTRNGSFDLCVRKVGTLTAALHNLKTGDVVGIRGPFGNGFDTEFLKGKDILFIGGGIGMVPLRSLIQYVLDNRGDYNKVMILYGAKTPKELLFVEETQQWSERDDIEYYVTVDRGDESWKGHTGVITTLIPPLDINVKNTYAVVVGPPIMYKFVILALKAKNIPDKQIIMSLERRMKCGVGKCGHCQMDHIYVCQDGPVFNYAQIKDFREAL